MVNVTWSAGIDSISGALAKPGKGTHSCKKMCLATHRVAATKNPECNRIYLRTKVKRSTAPSADELLARQRFTAVSRAIATRKMDISKVDSDQAAFEANKSQYGTMNAYYWSVCGAEYDQAHPRS